MTETPTDKKLSERFGEAINDGYEALGDLVAEYGDAILSVLRLAEAQPSAGTFKLGDFVQKKSGSSWRGKVVGFYSTNLTPRGYCVESAYESGSVQIYPEAALVAGAVDADHPSAIREAQIDDLRPDAIIIAEQQKKIALYRDIFAEITAKAVPWFASESDDPERVRGYKLPVGPIHRAAGDLNFQMFDGERYLSEALAIIATLTAALEEARGALVASRSFVEIVYEETDREEAADAKIVMGQIDAAIATINAVLGRMSPLTPGEKGEG